MKSKRDSPGPRAFRMIVSLVHGRCRRKQSRSDKKLVRRDLMPRVQTVESARAAIEVHGMPASRRKVMLEVIQKRGRNRIVVDKNAGPVGGETQRVGKHIGVFAQRV